MELRFMKHCDTNDNILKWSSEEIAIPYNKAVRTWLVNEAKWEAAKKVCELEGWDWKIMTEKQLTPDK